MASDDSGNYRISRRDYFAGCALKGILANPKVVTPDSHRLTITEELIDDTVEFADALIKELDNNDQAL